MEKRDASPAAGTNDTRHFQVFLLMHPAEGREVAINL